MEKAEYKESDSKEDVEMLNDEEDKDWDAEQEYMKEMHMSKEKMFKKLKDEQKKELKEIKKLSMEEKLDFLLKQAEKYSRFMLASEANEEKEEVKHTK